MAKLFKKIMGRSKAMGKRMEKAQEAVVFAEAGLTSSGAGETVVSEDFSASTGKLLVVGHESTFSESIVNYALEMAQRMSYGIIALNTAPLSCDAFKRLSTSQKQICQEFQDLSLEQARNFKKAAEEFGISFTHVIKFSEPDQALETIQKEYSDIEFIISDEQPQRATERVADVEQPRSRVYVYSMI